MKWSHLAGPIVLCAAIGVSPVMAQPKSLGTISFPNSGAKEAQDSFLAGVKYLHSFEFDDAAESFREAQKADPGFALAYWGEAMSYNHPLWAEQDFAAARKVLTKLGATRAERLAKAKTEKEKDLLDAVETLFGEGDKLTRDFAYSDAMAKAFQKQTNDHEVACLYALSLLGTVRPGDHGFRRQMLAASIVEKVFKENPDHPGAAHFLIHAFDDPEHAPLGLPAADAYAKIAPAAGHANHMPSHIFLQRGMWEKAAASNVAAYNSSVDWAQRKGLSTSRRDFHSLSWLQYAYLQLDQAAKAKETIDWIAQVAGESPTPRVTSVYESMRARQIIETQKWEKIAIPGATPTGQAVPMDGASRNYDASTALLLAAGISGAKLGDLDTARQAESRLKAMRESQQTAGRTYAAKNIEIMEKEVGAVIKIAEKQPDAALALAKAATEIEASLDPPSGPPEPIKPSHELYGELLLDAGHYADAVKAFEEALMRMPNRRLSVLGMQQAKAKATPKTTASAPQP
ncbi:MAG: hypothetical protein U0Q12_19940 [Vicinamibacterales bacterium]